MTCPQTIRDLVDERNLSLALLVRAGSRSYGLEVEESDDDWSGVVVPRLRDLLAIGGLERETWTGNEPDFTLHEIGKFCRLALKGNPAALEVLWNPDVREVDEWGRLLIKRRRSFLHRGSLEVYAAYAEAQMRKLMSGASLHTKGSTYNVKFGMHLIRLLHAGIELGRTGEVMVRVPSPLEESLRAIRSGSLSMEEVLDIARPLLDRLRAGAADNVLPLAPDIASVDDLVVQARLARADA